ncbi:MAG: hypothetical protein FWC47_06120 [Oscillospiraceae bacterium]|nr:hypothetical protein [Oscillospiraceae bacterium]
METTMIKYVFELENGGSRVETIRDIRADITNVEIIALANIIIEKGGEYKGSKFKSLTSCEKVTSLTEKITV